MCIFLGFRILYYLPLDNLEYIPPPYPLIKTKVNIDYGIGLNQNLLILYGDNVCKKILLIVDRHYARGNGLDRHNNIVSIDSPFGFGYLYSINVIFLIKFVIFECQTESFFDNQLSLNGKDIAQIFPCDRMLKQG